MSMIPSRAHSVVPFRNKSFDSNKVRGNGMVTCTAIGNQELCGVMCVTFHTVPSPWNSHTVHGGNICCPHYRMIISLFHTQLDARDSWSADHSWSHFAKSDVSPCPHAQSGDDEVYYQSGPSSQRCRDLRRARTRRPCGDPSWLDNLVKNPPPHLFSSALFFCLFFLFLSVFFCLNHLQFG